MKKTIWLFLLLVLLSACNLAEYAPAVKAQPLIPALPPQPSPTVGVSASSPTATATPVAVERPMQVCTGYPTGALNVRMCPGVQCWAFFVLDEGRVVTVDGVTEKADDGATWIHLIRPVDGWVNAKYLCEVEP